jgi:uncharacterized protein YggE
MLRPILFAAIAAAFAASTPAQSVGNRPFVHASGEGIVSIRPDQMKLNVGVTTQARTAQEAVDTNATLVSQVLIALRQLLGPNADLKTINFAVTPNYRYPQGGGQPEITGYTASNTIEVTTSDLTLSGRIIDAATQAGANQVTNLRFLLKDSEPAKSQALKAATQQAKAHAEAIAQGLGIQLGAVLAASEGFSTQYIPGPLDRGAGATAATTPVETGMLEVRATVSLDMEIVQ